MIRNKKAGERSKMMAPDMMTGLIVGLGLILVLIAIYVNVAGGIQGATEAYCKAVLRTRHAINPLDILIWNVGSTITSKASFLQVSNACAKMPDKPCATVEYCTTAIQQSIAYCREMQKSEPETSRPCMTALTIEPTDGTAASLCKDKICATSANCLPDKKEFEGLAVPESMLEYNFCPKPGASLSMKYDANKIIATCMGTGKDGGTLCPQKA